MKYLIVNADDFGCTRGINRGIAQAHRNGIVTSASLLVNSPWSEEAADMSRGMPRLSLGLHAELGRALEDTTSFSAVSVSLQQQFDRFHELTGSRPTHLDSRHNAHRDRRALPVFLRFAEQHGLALRGHSSARYFSRFYGRWGGETRSEQISAQNLAQMLETEIGDGITELSCHPGFVDADLCSDYRAEREAELRALCDPAVGEALETQSIELISFYGLNKVRLSVQPQAGIPSNLVQADHRHFSF